MSDKQQQSDTLLAFVNDKATFEVVTALALSRYGLSVDAHQANIKGAISYLKLNRSPRILLVDITGSDFPITDMKSLADVCEPGVQVIAIGDRNDVGVFRDLVDMGVKDYIAKPLNVGLLMRSIETLVGNTTQAKKSESGFSHAGKLISFIGARGGVGSSMLAANTAWALAHGYYKRVCMIDLDFQHGILSQVFNMDSPSAFRELLQSPERVDEAILTRSVVKVSEYLSTLSSPVPVDMDFPFPAQGMESLTPLLLSHYHYTMIDIPRYNHKNHYPILSKSNVVVLSFDFTLLSVRDVVSLLRILKESQDTRVLLVCNKLGEFKKGELEKKMFENSIQREVDLIIPFDPVKPLQTLNEGIPVASEKGIFSEGIYNLVSLITGKEAQHSPNKGSLLSGLFGGKQSA